MNTYTNSNPHRLFFALLFCAYCSFSSAQSNTYVSLDVRNTLDLSDKMVQQQQYRKGEQILRDLLQRTTLSHYEYGVASSRLAALLFEQQQYARAEQVLNKTLNEKSLPPSLKNNLRFNLAQVYLLLDRPQDAMQLLNTAITESDKPSSRLCFLMAMTLSAMDDEHNALVWAERGLETVAKPSQSQYAWVLSLRIANKKYQSARELLHIILARYPTQPVYWRQLVQIEMNLAHYQQALVIAKLAYRQNILTEQSDILRLAHLYLEQKLPYQAAVLLKRARDENRIEQTAEYWHMLSTAWLQAKEYQAASKALQRAAQLSDDGRFYAHLGHVYIERQQWLEAEQALSAAIDKGGLQYPESIRLLKGIALAELGHITRAETEFIYCLGFDRTYQTALSWLSAMSKDHAIP